MPDPDHLPESYQSTGHLAAGLQLYVAEITTAIALLGIQASYFQNGIAFYGDDSRNQLITHLLDADRLHHFDRE